MLKSQETPFRNICTHTLNYTRTTFPSEYLGGFDFMLLGKEPVTAYFNAQKGLEESYTCKKKELERM